ncbi:MAG: hypothetical protein A2Y60_02565 [Chloroflexi bacterium RBG_13_54_9]|nr:MAG: hypothetical protein A2Y60_02565 [Chloroflexi bacterium RBG_13_54_9]
MITDLDETLKQLLIQRVPLDPAEVEIAFDLPDREWTASLTKPALNLYLYDIRENRDFREADWVVERNGNKTGSRRRRPVRIDLAYMITAWTKAVEDQHRLLWHTLATLLRHPVLPEELLQGELRAVVERLELDVHMDTAQPDGIMKNPADYWSALDNELRPGINCVITVPLDLDLALTMPLVLTKVLRFPPPLKGMPEELVQVAGAVTAKGRPEQPIAGAMVSIKGRGLETITDEGGRYTLMGIPRGKHTLRVVVTGQPEREVGLDVPSATYDLEI